MIATYYFNSQTSSTYQRRIRLLPWVIIITVINTSIIYKKAHAEANIRETNCKLIFNHIFSLPRKIIELRASGSVVAANSKVGYTFWLSNASSSIHGFRAYFHHGTLAANTHRYTQVSPRPQFTRLVIYPNQTIKVARDRYRKLTHLRCFSLKEYKGKYLMMALLDLFDSNTPTSYEAWNIEVYSR